MSSKPGSLKPSDSPDYAWQILFGADNTAICGPRRSSAENLGWRGLRNSGDNNEMLDFPALYIDEAFRSLRGHKRLADGAIAQLNDEQFFAAPDPESNSVAIIVKHMAGNMRSRFTDFLTSDGEKPDRNRDSEFVISGAVGREQALRAWEHGWQLVFDALNSLQPEDLERTVIIRGEPHSVLQAINRQVAHYAYHIGQIVFLAKHWKGADWKTLSIPKGQSEQVNAKMLRKSVEER